ncbi:hypothetical protein CQ035_01730 [Brevundimonas sp. MYb46]|nr:hypothetical protein CQ026_01730 [Brevundimonas sp. MYb31]PRA27389.1 hypothetical protein CQ024_11430 [Brevundimonas sp. MYb27]PRB17776.1 hypothetical protein CQ039_01730 [Brevundimonas sp. MYb52]PRB38147.1 hypothetical protein CQ035_01730 [Brevundimonas sp. MYb46]PRB56071.1 hypothetical protein CQ028_01200 [Brevundimonas sp. MYb33]
MRLQRVANAPPLAGRRTLFEDLHTAGVGHQLVSADLIGAGHHRGRLGFHPPFVPGRGVGSATEAQPVALARIAPEKTAAGA